MSPALHTQPGRLLVARLSPVSRKQTLAKIQSGEGTDTELLGANHIPGIDYLTIGEYQNTDLASKILMRLPRAIQALFLLLQLFKYDFVIAQDNHLMGYAVSLCARVFRLKTRWIYISMSSSTLLRRHKAHPIRLFLFRTFWSSFAHIICISNEQIEDLVRLGVPRSRLTFIPYGIDARFFESNDTPQAEELIASIGRDMGRDYPTLFKAAERSAHQFLVFAGHKNVPPGTSFPPNVTVQYDKGNVAVRDLYKRTRLVAVVSKNIDIPDGSDCSGQTVILEALAAGKAVIATRRPWMTDYLVPGEDLVVIPPNDSHALVRAIESLWDDAEKRRRLAESGHRKVVERYTTQVFAEKLLALMHART